MIRFRRLHFTLLETLIAVALAVVILTTMMFFYREIDYINNQLEQVQKESFKMRYVESRLASIFPNAVAPSTNDSKDDFYFYTSSDLGLDTLPGSPATLVFTFDNGFDSDKLFANRVIGRIFLDSNKRLCLAKWPSPKRWVEGVAPPMKLEVLMEGVDSLTLSFFVAPEKKWKLDEKDEDADDDATQTPISQPPKGPPTKPQPPTTGQAGAPATTAGSNASPKAKPAPEGTWIEQWQNDFQLLPAMVKLQIKRGVETETFVFPLPKSTQPIVYKQ